MEINYCNKCYFELKWELKGRIEVRKKNIFAYTKVEGKERDY